MMAHNSSSKPETLEPATLDLLHKALAGYVAFPSDGDRLRDALHTISAEAHAKSMHPERLLVVLKDAWYQLPGVRAIGRDEDQVRLLQRVVTLCIKEYYR